MECKGISGGEELLDNKVCEAGNSIKFQAVILKEVTDSFEQYSDIDGNSDYKFIKSTSYYGYNSEFGCIINLHYL